MSSAPSTLFVALLSLTLVGCGIEEGEPQSAGPELAASSQEILGLPNLTQAVKTYGRVNLRLVFSEPVPDNTWCVNFVQQNKTTLAKTYCTPTSTSVITGATGTRKTASHSCIAHIDILCKS